MCGCCRWVSLNKAATQIVTTLPAGALALSAKYSNTVTKLFQSAVNANFTAVRCSCTARMRDHNCKPNLVSCFPWQHGHHLQLMGHQGWQMSQQ